MAKRTIYLDDDCDAIWRRLFDETGRNASKWIREHLIEEDKQMTDPYLLQKKINELKAEKEQIELSVSELNKRLAQSIKINNNEPTFNVQIDYMLLRNMTKGIVQTYGVNDSIASQLAKSYLSIDVKERPVLQNYMKMKLKELEGVQ
jgi:ATP-dependent exoDNAse (exonuclease V) alpha subunit